MAASTSLNSGLDRRRFPRPARPAARTPCLEALEPRELLATVAVNAGQVVRNVNTQLLGVNVAWWDSNLNTAQTAQLVQSAGLTSFRFPGGSSADDFHFNAPAMYNQSVSDSTMASFIASVHGQGIVTLDYGSGSPQEAAAFLAYLNGSPSNRTVIGMQGRNGTTRPIPGRPSTGRPPDTGPSCEPPHRWQPTTTASTSMRLKHPAPLNFHYWEVGNEEYGDWEIDHHTAQHDPATYVAFAKAFATLAAKISPGISIGIDAGSVSGDNNWVPNVLQQSVAQGFMPGFISDHNFVESAPDTRAIRTLLLEHRLRLQPRHGVRSARLGLACLGISGASVPVFRGCG